MTRDSEIIRDLIGLAFDPNPEDSNITLAMCLDLYERMLRRERILEDARTAVLVKEMEVRRAAASPPAESGPPEARPKEAALPHLSPGGAPPPEVQPVTRETAGSPPDKPGTITGRGSAEKRAIADRLDAYCERTGLGAAQRIADASGKKLTRDTVSQMKERTPFPLEKWRTLEKALDKLETAED